MISQVDHCKFVVVGFLLKSRRAAFMPDLNGLLITVSHSGNTSVHLDGTKMTFMLLCSLLWNFLSLGSSVGQAEVDLLNSQVNPFYFSFRIVSVLLCMAKLPSGCR